jgi:hypothetical protein
LFNNTITNLLPDEGYDLVADNNIEYNQRPPRTSNSKRIKVLSATTEIYKHSFFPRTVKDWITLTESAMTSKTIQSSPLKLPSQMNRNLVGSIYKVAY